MRPEILFNAVTCWARLVTKMTEGAMVSGRNLYELIQHINNHAEIERFPRKRPKCGFPVSPQLRKGYGLLARPTRRAS